MTLNHHPVKRTRDLVILENQDMNNFSTQIKSFEIYRVGKRGVDLEHLKNFSTQMKSFEIYRVDKRGVDLEIVKISRSEASRRETFHGAQNFLRLSVNRELSTRVITLPRFEASILTRREYATSFSSGSKSAAITSVVRKGRAKWLLAWSSSWPRKSGQNAGFMHFATTFYILVSGASPRITEHGTHGRQHLAANSGLSVFIAVISTAKEIATIFVNSTPSV